MMRVVAAIGDDGWRGRSRGAPGTRSTRSAEPVRLADGGSHVRRAHRGPKAFGDAVSPRLLVSASGSFDLRWSAGARPARRPCGASLSKSRADPSPRR